MENDNFDKSIQDLEKQLDSIGKFDERKLDDFIKQNYAEIWTKLSKEERQSRLKQMCDILNDASKKGEIEKILEKFKNYEQVKFNIEILFLGVILGVSGNLVANLIDRHLINLGFKYEIIVAIIFSLSLWYIYREFIKKPKEKIETNKIFTDFYAILEKDKSK